YPARWHGQRDPQLLIQLCQPDDVPPVAQQHLIHTAGAEELPAVRRALFARRRRRRRADLHLTSGGYHAARAYQNPTPPLPLLEMQVHALVRAVVGVAIVFVVDSAVAVDDAFELVVAPVALPGRQVPRDRLVDRDGRVHAGVPVAALVRHQGADEAV